MSTVYIVEGFIDEGRAQALLESCQQHKFDNSSGDCWDGRLLQPHMMTQGLLRQTKEIIAGVGERIMVTTNKSKLYPDTFNYVRWNVGDSMGLHADGDYDDGSYSWREFGAILYLHDDYEGGEICFPNQGLELKPKAGTLVFFPGKKPFLHCVKEVTRGPRYNLASFWATHEAYRPRSNS